MAKLEGIASGFTPPPPEPVKKKPRKKSSFSCRVCDCCGYSFEGTPYRTGKRFAIVPDGEDADETICVGCFTNFGMGDAYAHGIHPPETYQESQHKLERITEAKYVTILKTQTFVGEKTGRSFTVEFGDVFRAKRIGTTGEPDGSREYSQRMHTIDIQVGEETLTLFTHEIGVITWVEIMQGRQDGCYIESFLSPDDKDGYFTPTDEFKADLIATFGNR